MSFLTIRSLSARPRRRLVLGREERSPDITNEIDDLLEQMTHVRRQARQFVFPRGRCEGEVLRRNTSELKKVVDPRYTIALPMMYFP